MGLYKVNGGKNKKTDNKACFYERNVIIGFDKKCGILEINHFYFYPYDIDWIMVCKRVISIYLARKLIKVLLTSRVTLSFKPDLILLVNSYSPV